MDSIEGTLAAGDKQICVFVFEWDDRRGCGEAAFHFAILMLKRKLGPGNLLLGEA